MDTNSFIIKDVDSWCVWIITWEWQIYVSCGRFGVHIAIKSLFISIFMELSMLKFSLHNEFY
jgi:hypothetical protein